MQSVKRIIFIIRLVQLLMLFSASGIAQDIHAHKKFYTGLEMGTGWLHLSKNDVPANRTARYSLGFYGGYTPFRWLRVGINASGWLIEPFVYLRNSTEGVSVSNTNLQVVVFPCQKVNLFLNIQGGIATYTSKHFGEYNARGECAKAGVGYEYGISGNFGLSMTVNYGFGRLNDVKSPGISVVNQHYDVVEILIGVTYR